ncbi:dihydrofolate reductase family protein [Lactobacillus xylocopicola]|uniref:5-amino-6-(5-phosphoribosylamino)uracil reductase n=1 Tax=Lactobacillus xylocopicola TaxID=2976676 RepID=A0ABM8BIT1_9LACO|nr:dihydrofolate reductase family protein [Lactobacillus xylocopicola]BDR61207.1 5-amino-6-(5-phosphoribosylamino)uracil reductase [Lactobacillus xylocopicola]
MIRPKTTLFILTSLDGRITGNFSKALPTKYSSKIFQQIGFEHALTEDYNFQGWIYGSNTSTSYFAKGTPVINEDVPLVTAGDYISPVAHDVHYIALDRKGQLNWKSNTTSYEGHPAGVIEVLTDQASNGYKHFLRERHISYLMAGHQNIDLPLLLTKLVEIYHMSNILLGGGGILNWSFLSAGLCDEVAMLVTPAIDGLADTARLFNSQFAGDPHPIGFTLKECRVLKESNLWLRYTPNNVSARDQAAG